MYKIFPLPMGNLSINDLRIALINYLCATQASEQLIVRTQGEEQDILEMLALFGISYSQLYYQNNNFKIPSPICLHTFGHEEKAFICFCPHEASSCDSTCEHLSPEEVINNF